MYIWFYNLFNDSGLDLMIQRIYYLSLGGELESIRCKNEVS
jgi:hypothetical protein